MRKRSIIWSMFVLLGGMLVGLFCGAGYASYWFRHSLFDSNELWLHQNIAYLIRLRNNDVDSCIKAMELGLDNAVRQIAMEAKDRQGQIDPDQLSPLGLRALQRAQSYIDAGFESPFSTEAKQCLSNITLPNPSSIELEGQKAPDFALEKLTGDRFALSTEKANVIVLDFWASTCGPCLAILPAYENLHQWAKEHNKSLAIYCVNREEEPEIIADLWKKRSFDMPVLLDLDGEVAKAYRVDGIPQTVIIADGIVRYVRVGLMAAHEENLRTRIEGLLEKDLTAD